jgi:hypothetical protein
MVRSQEFGFVIENILRTKVFDLPEKNNDTKHYDIPANENKFDNKENISIKTSGSNIICLGDVLRIFNSEQTTLILIMYSQIQSQRKIKEIIEIKFNSELKTLLFGLTKEEEIKNVQKYIKEIPQGSTSSEIKKTYKKMTKDLKKGLITFNAKVDSKNQRRLQCSISVNTLLSYPQFIISKNKDILREIKIEDTYNFPKRIRNKKIKNGI